MAIRSPIRVSTRTFTRIHQDHRVSERPSYWLSIGLRSNPGIVMLRRSPGLSHGTLTILMSSSNSVAPAQPTLCFMLSRSSIPYWLVGATINSMYVRTTKSLASEVLFCSSQTTAISARGGEPGRASFHRSNCVLLMTLALPSSVSEAKKPQLETEMPVWIAALIGSPPPGWPSITPRRSPRHKAISTLRWFIGLIVPLVVAHCHADFGWLHLVVPLPDGSAVHQRFCVPKSLRIEERKEFWQ